MLFPLLACFVLTSSVLSASSTLKTSSATYTFFDDSALCSLSTDEYYLGFYTGGDAYVRAWDPSTYPKTPVGDCSKTFTTSSGNGIKYSFGSGDYINDCSVRLEFYTYSDDYGHPDKSYSCYDTLPTATQTSEHGDLTIKLINSDLYSTDFDLNLHIWIYDYATTTPYHDDYDSITTPQIVGAVIGSIVFAASIAVISVFLRRRRVINGELFSPVLSQ